MLYNSMKGLDKMFVDKELILIFGLFFLIFLLKNIYYMIIVSKIKKEIKKININSFVIFKNEKEIKMYNCLLNIEAYLRGEIKK